MSDRDKWVWKPDMVEVVKGTVEVTADDEREVDRRLEADHFDVGLDDNVGFSWPDPDR